MSSNVVVWFRNDLRIADNTALSSAVKFILKNKSSQTAKGRVYGLFLVSPYEWVTLNKWGLPKCDYYVRNAIALQTELAKYNVSLTVRLIRSKIPITVDDSVEFDPPADKLNHAIGEIAQEVLSAMNSLESSHCFVNRSYDSVSLDIEREVHESLSKSGFTLHSFDDECVVPVNSVRSQSGTMPKVYSPFKKLWTLYIEANGVGVIDTRQHLSSLNQVIADIRVHKQDNMVSAANETLKSNESIFGRPEEFFETVEEAVRSSNVLNMLSEMPEFACMNLEKFAQDFSGGEISAMNDLNTFFDEMLAARDSSPGYKVLRDSHSRGGASRMSAPLAVGALSLRTCLVRALAAEMEWTGKTVSFSSALEGKSGIGHWISELAWRDFFRHILVAYPHVSRGLAFQEEYEHLPWRAWPMNGEGERDFDAWCHGLTGYPIVDAAMRQIKLDGWLDNRTRMIVAMFLTKDLMIHWRRGERYFQRHLVDYDFASNNGGWQWSANTGTDSQPYFRVFNPLLQSEKYTRDGKFIRTYVPELSTLFNAAIHEPHSRLRGNQFQSLGYPPPIVTHNEAKLRAQAFFSPRKK